MVEVYIRNLELSDASVSFKWRNDNEVWRFTGNRPNVTVSEEIERNWLSEKLNNNNEKRFAICIKDTDEYIGNVQLTNITRFDAEFHIFIGERKYWGKGISKVVTSQLLKLAFEKFKLNSVYLSVNKNNIAAIKSYEYAGFVKTLEVDNFCKMIAFANNEKVKLSVFMITYNHDKYIQKALESIVSQKCKFEFNIVIGDDCSNDFTRKIIEEYIERYPKLFRVIFHPENVGAQLNQDTVFGCCNGKYIAICEGDDYWTDNLKLQKQIDFLDANQACTLCFHDAKMVYENGSKADKLFSEMFGSFYINRKFSHGDIVKNDWFISTPTMVFRNDAYRRYDWMKKVYSGDYSLHLILTESGYAYYLPEVMAVVRKHDAGVSQIGSEKKKLQRTISQQKIFSEYVDAKYKIFFYKRIIRISLNGIRSSSSDVSIQFRITCLKDLLKYSFKYYGSKL